MNLTGEPTLEKIDDYNNNETPQKRKTIRLVVVGLLLFAVVLVVIKVTNSSVSDYIGTSENPGIEVTRH